MDKNRYYESFKENEERINYLKYGLLNDRGYNIEKTREEYREKELERVTCNPRSNKKYENK